MRLTKLEIENFKGIGERQVIPIKPITLLFGPNSAGKSTILQAIKFYNYVLNEHLNKSNKTSETEGDTWNLFTISHNHELENSIKIKAGFSVNEENRLHSFQMNEFPELDKSSKLIFDYPLLDKLHENTYRRLGIGYLNQTTDANKVTESAIEIEVAAFKDSLTGKLLNEWYLKSIEIEINNEKILNIDILSSKIEISLSHLLLLTPQEPDQVSLRQIRKSNSNIYNINKQPNHNDKTKNSKHNHKNLESEKSSTTTLFLGELMKLSEESGLNLEFDDINNIASLKLSDIKLELDPNNFFNEHPYLERHLNEALIDQSGYENKYNVKHIVDNLPIQLAKETSGNNVGNKERSYFNEPWLRLEMLLSEIVCGSTHLAMKATGMGINSSLIGPLRPIPDRGKAGTDLDMASVELLQSINYWLEERFKLDYIIERFHLKLAPVEQMRCLEGEIRIADIEDKYMFDPTIYFSDIPIKYRSLAKLYDKKRNIYHNFKDVGVGISQLVPILSAVLNEEKLGYIAMEQPELHLHPGIQVVLGDLFIELVRMWDGSVFERVFLIETHSEHLLLRLLRRIRETTDNSLKTKETELRTDDLSVIYVESVRNKIRIKPLKVNDDGEFMDRWPNGFFDDRAEELF
ncbi:MAG: AAA family ATPase [Gammaproteobacteria bacterium]|nr:AAA family ATPase [Gammaproteobacteria bacterium]